MRMYMYMLMYAHMHSHVICIRNKIMCVPGTYMYTVYKETAYTRKIKVYTYIIIQVECQVHTLIGDRGPKGPG